jgi:hypothetical protein
MTPLLRLFDQFVKFVPRQRALIKKQNLLVAVGRLLGKITPVNGVWFF